MGTNFYVKGHRGNDDPKFHIGKRSAAGLYCWDCGVSLCKGGAARVHYENDFFDKCPKCGKSHEKETLSTSCVGRELGFNTEKPEKKTGVKGCSSFTWARPIGHIKNIVDEYGTEYTLEEFRAVLEECPIRIERYGVHFS
jgi:hypothetical protein